MADDIHKDALERFDQSQDGSSHVREAALSDIEFARLGKQWSAKDEMVRRAEGRPTLTMNKLPSFIRQVVNKARQGRPALAVHPVDGGADYDTAQVIGGLMRSIERASNAGVAYDTAVEHAVSGGFGFFRISTDYAHPESFDLEARIERVSNPFTIHWDTNSVAADASDWEYAFVSDMLTQDEFKRRYPKETPAHFDAGRGDEYGDDWKNDERVRVAEYWLREEKTRKLLLLSDGRVVREDALKQPVEVMPGLMIPQAEVMAMAGVTVVKEREATYHTVKRRMISGLAVLEEEEWPGSMIPICPVWGEEVVYLGKRYFRSLVRDARDAQLMYNFWRTASTELVALAPRAPWLIKEGAIPPGAEQIWATANTRSHAYLPYRGDVMPVRQTFAGVPAGALQEALNASDDMKSIMGIFDASLGAQGNETSGRAIMARQRQADDGNFHFIDNLGRAIEYAGRCLLEIIPSIYNERQAISILGEDMRPQVVRLTSESGVPPSAEDPNGRLYNLSVGKYDVTVKTGANYATQREEAREALIEIMRAVPDSALVLGDLILKNMDFPEADTAAERITMLQNLTLQRMMPPQPPPMAPPDGMPSEMMQQGAPPGALSNSGPAL